MGSAVAGAILGRCCLAVPAGAAAAKDETVWLCKPGLADNPCKPGLEHDPDLADRARCSATTQPKAKKPKVDCFYVYPTVSDDEGRNSDLSIDPEERSIALYQAARYSQRCRVFAPMYRQITLQALFSGQPVTEAESDARLRRRGRAPGRPTCGSTTTAAASSCSATRRARSCSAS